jgi:hypothetical protein
MEVLWAIREGIRRIDPNCNDWREVRANKAHECVRECRTERYTSYSTDDVITCQGLRICAGCMAMVLYFKKAYHLPPEIYTHWDYAEHKPVLIEGSQGDY